MTKEEAIKLLNSKIEELDQVHSNDEFIGWRLSAVQRLQVICPDSHIVKEIAKIKPTEVYSGKSTVHKLKPELKKMLISLVEDLEVMGIEVYKSKENNSSTITVQNSNTQSQSQEQQQKVTLSFEFVVECLTKGLRDTEVEELKEILSSDDDPKIKKKKFSEKLRSFGSNVASNVLANIMTNPQVFEQLGGML